MSYWQAIFLGIIQGLTEFLPVSSSGHLVIFQKFLETPGNHLAFDVAVHFGTLLSVLTIYRRELLALLRQFFSGVLEKNINNGLRLFLYVCLASIPTGLMGVFLQDYWSSLFSQLQYVGMFLILTGLLLVLTRQKKTEDMQWSSEELKVESLSFKKAFIIGVAQGCAILPGVSRSGTTIAVSLLLKVDRSLAAFFSFLLMIPAVLGASLLEFTKVDWQTTDATPMFIGFVFAYFSGLFGLWMVLKVVKKGRLEVFSPYLWLLGSGLIFYALFG